MKLSQLYKEIKIIKPGSTFTVTPKGKEWLENYNSWWGLNRKLGMNDLQFEVEEVEKFNPQLILLLNMHIYSDLYGEDIIKINDINKIEDVLEKQSNTLGSNNEFFKKNLKQLEEKGWITPIKI